MNRSMAIAVYGVIGVLTAMIIVIFFPKDCSVLEVEEGFQGATSITMKSCPAGTKAYTDKAGNLNCCAGPVNGSACEGKIQCTFSSSTGNNIPFCTRSAYISILGKQQDIPVQRIDKLGDKTLYSIQFEQYVVIVSSDNETGYYVGSIQNLIPSAFTTYNSLRPGLFSLRML